jgi:hypothetical protein
MMRCEICGRGCKSFKSLGIHISKSHKIKSEEYYLKYINPVKGKCKTCGEYTKFISLKDGYQHHCNSICSNNDLDVKIKKENTSTINYGCKNPMQNKDVVKKVEETCLKNHGVRHPYQNEEIRNKGQETCLKNNGVRHPYQNEEIMKKRNDTCLKNHGVTNPMQSEEIRNKGKETCLKNHGVRYPSQNKEIRNKQTDTCENKFNCKYPSQNKEIAKKIGHSVKLNYTKVLERYPELIRIEKLKEGPNGEILGRCKNSNCKNSKDNDGYFELTSYQIQFRNQGINSLNDGNYFYCCEECKKSCILYGKSADQLNNIFDPYDDLNKASQSELTIWKFEVFVRQLKDNPDHEENFCEKCHSEEDLHCHHELPQKLYPGYALDPINGIILCSKCHYEIGHEKGTECSTGYLANKICK